MTFLERILRRMGSVSPSSPGRDFRRVAAVSRSLDHENFACGVGATRLAGTRRASERFHFDVGAPLTVFGDSATGSAAAGLAWNDTTALVKDSTLISPAIDILEYDTRDDVTALANLTTLRFEGVTIEHPDVNGMLRAIRFDVLRNPGAVQLGAAAAVNLTGMVAATPVALFTQNVAIAEDVPLSTESYVVRLMSITTHEFVSDEVVYPNLSVQAVLHFSSAPVAW